MTQPTGSNSGSSNSGNGTSNNRNRRRRRRGGSGQGNKPNGNNAAKNQNNNAQASGNNPGNQQNKSASGNSSSPSRSRRGGRGRRGRGNNNQGSKTPQLHGMDLVRAKYLGFVEKHVEARRKYYDYFHRADPNQLRKLEREFTDSQAQLLAYEESLSPKEREQLTIDYGGRPEDRVYSSNHEISPEQQFVSEKGDFEDPHLLESQKNLDFSRDTEESVGSIDDYKRLKGLM